MYELPTSIFINDIEYTIRNKGDFRMVLDCLAALQDPELENEYKVITALMIFFEVFESYADIDTHSKHLEPMVREMFKFINGGQEGSPGANKNTTLIKWKEDCQIICAAVNNVAGHEIRVVPYMHWWTFLGYFMSVGQSVLSTVVSIRYKTSRGKKLEKWEQDFKKENPQYFKTTVSKEEQEWLDYIKAMWDKGGAD